MYSCENTSTNETYIIENNGLNKLTGTELNSHWITGSKVIESIKRRVESRTL